MLPRFEVWQKALRPMQQKWATIGVHESEDIHSCSAQLCNEATRNAITALYEPEAALIPQPGQITRGQPAIRFALQ